MERERVNVSGYSFNGEVKFLFDRRYSITQKEYPVVIFCSYYADNRIHCCYREIRRV